MSCVNCDLGLGAVALAQNPQRPLPPKTDRMALLFDWTAVTTDVSARVLERVNAALAAAPLPGVLAPRLAAHVRL